MKESDGIKKDQIYRLSTATRDAPWSFLFSLKYDVRDAMLQDNEKMKVQYLRSLPSDLFETLQAIRTGSK